MRLAKSATHVYAQVRKEILQIVRRPGTFLSLVLGPFAIMALLGLGYSGYRAPFQTVLVIPASLPLSHDPAFYQNLAGPAVHIDRVDADQSVALDQLAHAQLDLVVIAPADGVEAVREGHHAQIQLDYDEVDPGIGAALSLLAGNLSAAINREIISQATQRGEAWILRGTDPGVQLVIPPDVIAEPTQTVVTNLAPSEPSLVIFFAPAVIALILQHMSVTLSALSFVRERQAGTLELFRVSPVSAVELMLGRLIGFGLIGAVIAAVVTLGSMALLNVPILGDPWLVALVIALLMAASLGVGLLISVVSSTERQAVQLSLLVLLASVFFGGFVLRVADFAPAVQLVAYALPVTHGIRLLQDLMLRGGTNATWELAALAGMAVVLLVATTVLLRRSMSRG